MHIHASQPNPNLQLDALCAAERVSAKREVERTRKKLLEFASQLSAEAESGDGCVVRLEASPDSQSSPRHKNQTDQKKEEPRAASLQESKIISDWA